MNSSGKTNPPELCEGAVALAQLLVLRIDWLQMSSDAIQYNRYTSDTIQNHKDVIKLIANFLMIKQKGRLTTNKEWIFNCTQCLCNLGLEDFLIIPFCLFSCPGNSIYTWLGDILSQDTFCPATYCPGDILSQLKEVDILSQDTLATRVHQNIKKFSKFHSNLIYVVSIWKKTKNAKKWFLGRFHSLVTIS